MADSDPSDPGLPPTHSTTSASYEGLIQRASGSTVGGYRIVAELGRGGFGTVYKAIESRTTGIARTVALKVLRLDRQSPNVVNHFRREMEILKELHHENIVGYLDDGEDDGRLFYVMEYVEGLPITEFADRNRLSVDERLDLFRQVCEAIEFAHRQLVVHRDLKPRNILVTTDGRRAVKVLDFGIATFSDPYRMANEAIVTVAPENALTPEYSSPEQLRGVSRTSVLLDVYSLGVVLFELLAGHRPHQIDRALGLALMAEQIEHAKPIPPSVRAGTTDEGVSAVDPESGRPSTRAITPDSVAQMRGTRPERLRRELAGELDLIALMAIRPEPERRYQRVADLIDDVDRFRANRPIRARPDSAMYRARKFGRRHRWPLLAGGTAMAGLLAAGVATVLWAGAEARAGREAEARALRERENESLRADQAEAKLAGYERLADLLVEHAGRFSGTLRARQDLISIGLAYVDRAFDESSPRDARSLRRGAQMANRMLAALADLNSPNREAAPQVAELLQSARVNAATWRTLLAQGPDDVDVLVGVARAERSVARLERAAAGSAGEGMVKATAAAARASAIAGDGWRLRPDATTAVATLEARSTLIELFQQTRNPAVVEECAALAVLLDSPAVAGVIASCDEAQRSDLLLAVSSGHVRLGHASFSAAGARGPSRISLGGSPPRVDSPQINNLVAAKDRFTQAHALLLRLPESERATLRTLRPLRDVHQLLCSTEREIVAAGGAGRPEESRSHLEAFERCAQQGWSRDPDLEESFSDFSRAAELEARLAWLLGDVAAARAAFQRALDHLATVQLLAAPQLPGVALFAGGAPAAARPATGSRLARREGIVRTDFALLLGRAGATAEAKAEAAEAVFCWRVSRAPDAPPSDDEIDYVTALREAGLLAEE